MISALRNQKTFESSMLDGLLNYLSGDRLLALTGNLARNILVPIAAMLVFLLLWNAGAKQVQTSLGELPGPERVWEQSIALYGEHKAEREREAAEFRAQGFEQAQRIRAAADREATVIRAEAQKEAEIERGKGEGLRTQILNDAFGRDTDFFNFYRSMQAYEGSLAGQSTYMVLSPDSEFFDFFTEIGTPASR